MNITNLLLFLILVTIATYTFMPWRGIDKGSLSKLILQWFIWVVIFSTVIVVAIKLGIIQQ
mgnify:FL=1|tara:strand:- start:178 stop:360 length:183 start_codon:yes stop_codon:yes gene_type:complete